MWAVPAYVALVLGIDTLATQEVEWLIDWTSLQWMAGSFDLYKWLAWGLLPFLICWPRMRWSWLNPGALNRQDMAFLFVILLGGMAAMALIPHVPALQQNYPAWQLLPADLRWQQFQGQLMWTLSWLLGWEFLHRYCLLRAALRISPAWGWWLVPLSEGLYHLQKPLLEAAGMVLLSILLTQWTLRRGNLMPALLAHCLIELELMAYQWL